MLSDKLEQAYQQGVGFFKVEQVEVTLEHLPLQEFFFGNTCSHQIYWQERTGEQRLAWGLVENLTGSAGKQQLLARLQSSQPGVRYYGGQAFFQQQLSPASIWKNWGSSQFWLPRLEMLWHNNSLQAKLNFFPSESKKQLQQEIARLLEKSPAHQTTSGKLVFSHHTPNYEHWQQAVTQLTQQMTTHNLHKVVLARQSTFEYEGAIEEIFFHRLLPRESNTFCFFFRNHQEIWWGATPERLYQRQGNLLASEAIAGTRKRGRNEQQEQSLTTELLASTKDNQEQQLVVEAIVAALAPLSSQSPQLAAKEVLKLSRLQHLCTKITLELSSNVSPFTILAQLHPTPAVGGTPQELALQWIAELEKFERGWYAGPLGWLEKNQEQFVVAIRSALAQKNLLHFFAGAGIVAQSHAESEWQEIEAKTHNLVSLF